MLSEPENEAKITREEMIELFGEAMPLEAGNLLFDTDGDKTIGQVRAELRKIAAERRPASLDTSDLVRRLAEPLTAEIARQVGGAVGRDGSYNMTAAMVEIDKVLDGRLAAAAAALSALQHQVEVLTRANATRPDYDLHCEECGRAHILDTSLPSEIWNQIADPADILCTTCIDSRLAAKGLTALAEFYFVGEALTSKLYDRDLSSRLEAAEAKVAERDAALEIADMAFTDIAEFRPIAGNEFQQIATHARATTLEALPKVRRARTALNSTKE